MLKTNQIYNMDCLLGIQKMLEHGIQADLIVTDPPYFIKSTKAGGHSELARSIQPMNDQLESAEHLHLVQRRADPAVHRFFR